jgi:hypothetical protein
MDMFRDYAARGDAFADAARAVAGGPGPDGAADASGGAPAPDRVDGPGAA